VKIKIKNKSEGNKKNDCRVKLKRKLTLTKGGKFKKTRTKLKKKLIRHKI
jgi:hypothetical protein